MRRVIISGLVAAVFAVVSSADGAPSDSWSAAEVVAPAKVGTRTGAQLQAVEVGTDTTLVVWSTSSDGIYAAEREGGGQWSTPEHVATLQVNPRLTKLEFRLEAHGSRAQLVWMSEPICDCSGKNHFRFGARSFAAGKGWSRPQAITTVRDHYVLGWDMAVTAEDVPALVWEDETSHATKIAYTWRPSTGAWHAPTVLAGPYPRGANVGDTTVSVFATGFLRASDGTHLKLSLFEVTSKVGASGLTHRPRNEIIYMSVNNTGALAAPASVPLAPGVQPLVSKTSMTIDANGYPVVAYGAGSGWQVVRRNGQQWVTQRVEGAKGPSLPFLFALLGGREVMIYGGYGLVSSARDASADRYTQLGLVGTPRAATVPTQDNPVYTESAEGSLLFFWADTAAFHVSTLPQGSSQWSTSGERLLLPAGHLVYNAAALAQHDGSVLLVFLDQRSKGSEQNTYELRSSTYQP